MKFLPFIFLYFLSFNLSAQSGNKTVWLDELDISKIIQDRSEPHRNKNTQGGSISLGGKEYERGVGTHSTSTFYINLGGAARSFSAVVGLDDIVRGQKGGAQEFLVIGDDKILWRSGFMDQNSFPKKLEVNLAGVDILLLMVIHERGKLRGFANWADAKFVVTGQTPEAFIPQEEPYILTPKAPEEPRINGASVFGARPASPFFFKVAASGNKPVTYEAKSLPAGLSIDSKSGVITGKVKRRGTYHVQLTATNIKGKDEKPLKIIIGDEIALTPPMGWNNWNAYGKDFDEKIVRQTAQAFLDFGLIDYGWTYVNMDDGWQGERGGKFNAIMPNEKFTDMKKMCDDIHAKGLKVGIYSTPWRTSYAGFTGGSADTPEGKNPYQYIEYRWDYGVYPFYVQDAKQWGEWGIDYLKYDWNPITMAHTVETEKALKKSSRDMVYSLSNNMDLADVAAISTHANAWRTTGDIHDSWGSVYSIIQQMAKWPEHSRPGHWNDADMLVVGWMGGWHGDLHASRLTPTEQYSHVSMWAMFASPMLLGCDLTLLDDFTVNLLTNPEVIAINQDPLGKGAERVFQDGLIEIWQKDLADGSKAVALCNFGLNETEVKLDWSLLGITGKKILRDVWRHKDIGKFESVFSTTVHGHGVVLLKILN